LGSSGFPCPRQSRAGREIADGAVADPAGAGRGVRLLGDGELCAGCGDVLSERLRLRRDFVRFYEVPAAGGEQREISDLSRVNSERSLERQLAQPRQVDDAPEGVDAQPKHFSGDRH
jgi:hypothetical protein